MQKNSRSSKISNELKAATVMKLAILIDFHDFGFLLGN